MKNNATQQKQTAFAIGIALGKTGAYSKRCASLKVINEKL